MCCNTKLAISQALLDLMQEQPLKHITVQDIMDRTHMKRQSFYYHFQDVYDVLEWEVDRRLFQNLAFDPEQEYEDWHIDLMDLLLQDRSFYRKVLNAIDPATVLRQCDPVLRPQVCRRLLGEPFPEADALSDEENYQIDFYVRSICNEYVYLLRSRAPLDEEACRRRIHFLCSQPSAYLMV